MTILISHRLTFFPRVEMAQPARAPAAPAALLTSVAWDGLEEENAP